MSENISLEEIKKIWPSSAPDMDNINKYAEKYRDETITGGMIPKINTCLDSVNNGVRGVVIMDGRKSHSILNEIFSDTGAGTLIR